MVASAVMIAGVFVYGTLKPGGRNYAVAERAGVVARLEACLHGFRLYGLEPEGYPAMVRGEGRVYGWVLTFRDITAALPLLDGLEGCHLNPPLYERVAVAWQAAQVWTYLYARPERLVEPGARPVEDGHWSA
ncbi:MAG: gamma-glutamylcyclotransferase [Deinococcota bacterium]|jgi:gamma-glutamylcyclotransferase (GGCT)/AIG2-like uncharacterized protein YtfP|nr:gamma-glutamylcyclotransferase [Deinococcota bacterium]